MVPPHLHRTLLALVLLASLTAWLTTYLATGLATRRDAERAADPPNAATVAASAGVKGPQGGAGAARLEPTLKVEMTAYTSVAAQTDGTPKLTASGAVAGPGTTAASRDLLERLPYGTQVEVLSVSGEGCGGWVPETPLSVADTMHPRIENHLDVWLPTTEQARNWGRCQAVVRVVGSYEP